MASFVFVSFGNRQQHLFNIDCRLSILSEHIRNVCAREMNIMMQRNIDSIRVSQREDEKELEECKKELEGEMDAEGQGVINARIKGLEERKTLYSAQLEVAQSGLMMSRHLDAKEKPIILGLEDERKQFIQLSGVSGNGLEILQARAKYSLCYMIDDARQNACANIPRTLDDLGVGKARSPSPGAKTKPKQKKK